jgi:hypothetical protein
MAFLFFIRTGVNGWVGQVGNFDKHCVVFYAWYYASKVYRKSKKRYNIPS